MPRSPGFGIGRPVSEPDHRRRGEPAARSPRPRTPRGSSSTFHDRPGRPRPRRLERGAAAHRARHARSTAVDRHRDTYLLGPARAPAWRSWVPWSSPSCSVEASERDPTRSRRPRRGRPRHRAGASSSACPTSTRSSRSSSAPTRRGPTSTSPSSSATTCCPTSSSAVRGLMAYEQGVLTAVTQARAAYSPTDPIPAQAATSDQTTAGGPLALRRGRALPGHQVRHERPRPPGRDRADRGDHRGPPRALQRPGLSLQHEDRDGARDRPGLALPLGTARVLRSRAGRTPSARTSS